MMQRIVLRLIFFMGFACTANLAQAQNKQLHHEIEKLIRHETVIDFKIVPTVIVMSVDGDFISMDTFGIPLERNESNVHQRLWELGSVSKPFIAVLAQQALNRLGLDEESLLCSVMPDSLCHDHWATISFRQILEHRAGLPLISMQMAQAEKDVHDPYKDYHPDHLTKDILTTDPVPGQYAFSHLGYATLYWLFQKVGGLDSFLKEQFPDESGIKVYDQIEDSLLVQGHGLDGKVTSYWHTEVLSPAFGLKTDIPSLYQFITRWFMQREEVLGSPDAALLAELEMNEKKKEFKVMDGWLVWRKAKSIVYYLHGHTGGHAVSVAFIPAEHRAVLVFADGAAGTQDLSLLVLDMLQRGKKK